MSYALFEFTGILTDNGLQIGSVPAGFTPGDFSFISSAPRQIGIAGVPEPSATILLLPGLIPLARRKMRGHR